MTLNPESLAALWRELKVQEHPVLALPTLGQVAALLASGEGGRQQLLDLIGQRQQLLEWMERDPLRHGWQPAMWGRAKALLEQVSELLIMGGNRSTKTEFAAWYACEDLSFKERRIWAFLHSSEDSCVRLQHPRIYKYLPPEWRDAGKVGKRVFVVYTEKNGFSDNIFILPNGSRGMFFNYKQDPKVLEGYEFDGVWADELIPPDFLLALRFRLITRRGKMIITFTPVEGYTPVVGEYLSAAQIVESLPSELLPGENVKGCPPGHMPYVMRCVHPKRAVIFFFTEFNKFNPYDELKAQLQASPTREKKIRAYGWPDRAKGNVFPKFGAHNIVKDVKKVVQDLGGRATRYHYIDFAWDRNWFMLWILVLEHKGRKKVIIEREWPDYQTFGEWVLPSKKPDGDRGSAQTSLGFGIKDYKKLIIAIEKELTERHGDFPVFMRRCDPRSGRAVATTEDGGTCLIDMMQDEQRAEDGLLPSMDVQAASGDNITEGVNLINEWLEYDDTRPIDVMNEPVLLVNEDCRNIIDCLRMWTGQDGLKGASKDPIDTLRYAAQDGIEFVDLAVFGSWGGGSY